MSITPVSPAGLDLPHREIDDVSGILTWGLVEALLLEASLEASASK